MTQVSPFILYPDPRLKLGAVPRALDAQLISTGKALLEAATAHRAYGLAAAHLGRIEPVVVVSVGSPESRDYRLFFNPEIKETGGETSSAVEGSVSLPGVEVEVIRPAEVQIAFDDETGARQVLALSSFAARVAIHEIEQMNGIFFLDRVSRLKRDAAVRRYQKLVREGR